jgi:hypothetical protein
MKNQPIQVLRGNEKILSGIRRVELSKSTMSYPIMVAPFRVAMNLITMEDNPLPPAALPPANNITTDVAKRPGGRFHQAIYIASCRGQNQLMTEE